MNETTWHTPADAFDWGVKAAASHAFVGMRHGTMRVLLYAPKGVDTQTPHAQDEVYIVKSGSGVFDKAGERLPFGPGDVIFVEAGVEHRFCDFTDDFAAWAIFWGPEGGER